MYKNARSNQRQQSSSKLRIFRVFEYRNKYRITYGFIRRDYCEYTQSVLVAISNKATQTCSSTNCEHRHRQLETSFVPSVHWMRYRAIRMLMKMDDGVRFGWLLKEYRFSIHIFTSFVSNTNTNSQTNTITTMPAISHKHKHKSVPPQRAQGDEGQTSRQADNQ